MGKHLQNRVRFFVTCILCACLLSRAANSQTQTSPCSSNNIQWSCPYTAPDSVGQMLEDLFSKVLKTCNVYPLKLEKTGFFGTPLNSSSVQISSVPIELQSELPVERGVWYSPDAPATNRNIERFFSLISNTNVIKELDGNKEEFFNEQPSASDPSAALVRGQSYVIYTNDCARVVNAATSASTQFAVPPVSIKAALSGQFNGSRKTTVGVLEGTFESPYTRDLEREASPERLSVLMKLWNWYLRSIAKEEELKQPRYLLRDVRGIVTFSLTESQQSLDGKVDLAVDANAPTAVVSASVKAAGEARSKLIVNRVGIGIYKDANTGGLNLRTKQIPTLDQLSIQIQAYKLRLESSDLYDVENTKTLPSHKVYIDGLPEENCSPDFFYVTPSKIPDSDLKITLRPLIAMPGPSTIRQSDGRMISKCTFEIKPNLNRLLKPQESFSLRYYLGSIRPILSRSVILNGPPATYAYKGQ
jgi:hypothetical protein